MTRWACPIGVRSESIEVTYHCPAGCELRFYTFSTDNSTHAYCVGADGTQCDDPRVEVHEGNFVSGGTSQSLTVGNKTTSNLQKKLNTISARVAKKTVQKPTSTKPQAQDMVADGGAVAINCPAGCTPNCTILSNVVLCECQASDGSICKAEVVVADDATVLK